MLVWLRSNGGRQGINKAVPIIMPFIIAIGLAYGRTPMSLIDGSGFSFQRRTVFTNTSTVNGELGKVVLLTGANEAGIRRQPFNIHQNQNQPLYLS